MPQTRDVGSYNPLDPEVVENPYEFYAALREQAPVYRVPGLGFFIVSTYAEALEVLEDPQRFSSRLGPGVNEGVDEEMAAILRQGYPQVDTLLTNDPPEHIRYRALVTRAFSGRRVASMEGYIREIAEELVGAFAARGSVELMSELAVPLPLTVIADQVGVPRRDMTLFKKWSDDAVAPLGGMVSRERQLSCAHSLVEMQRYFVERIEERRAEPRDDILSSLSTARLEGSEPLDMAEILNIVQQLLAAGNETTTNLIGSAARLLAEHPDQLELVQDDCALIPNLVEEALRLESPVQGLFRKATRDLELGGTKIPEGARLVVMYAAANRDASVFEDPERFDVRRRNARSHLAFGKGEHFCVGAALARKEAAIAFETLLPRVRGLRVQPDIPAPRHTPSFILRGLQELRLRFEPI